MGVKEDYSEVFRRVFTRVLNRVGISTLKKTSMFGGGEHKS